VLVKIVLISKIYIKKKKELFKTKLGVDETFTAHTQKAKQQQRVHHIFQYIV
jgi:hypothetical protein